MFTFTLQLIAFKDETNLKNALQNCISKENLTVTDDPEKFCVFWKLFTSV